MTLTKPREGEFFFQEKTTDECLDGFQEMCTVVGAALFEVSGGLDGSAVALDARKPVSCGEPIFVGNTAVDTRAYFFPESASYVCDSGYTSSCQANGAFIWLKSCKVLSCGVPEEHHGNLAPDDEVFFPRGLPAGLHAALG